MNVFTTHERRQNEMDTNSGLVAVDKTYIQRTLCKRPKYRTVEKKKNITAGKEDYEK